jgi:PAS domain S-box-containing protein
LTNGVLSLQQLDFMRIRSHLLILVLGTLLPILILTVIISVVFWREQRTAVERRYLERVRALSVALDRELEGHIRALQILAEASSLRSGDWRAFYDEALRVRDLQSSWINLIVNDPATGRQLLNLRRPLGAPPVETTADQATLKNVVATGRALVSPLMKGRVSNEYATAVIVPAKNDAGQHYVLVAVIRPSNWLRFLSSYPVAPDATMTLLDQNGVIIARTLNNQTWVGKRPAPALFDLSRKLPEAAYKSIGLEGQSFYSAHSRSQLAGWTVATGVSAETVEAVLWSSILTMAGAILGTAALALLLAYLFGRRIIHAFESLTRSAGALIRGAPPPNAFAVKEASDVAAAFQDAAEQLKSQDAVLRESETRFRAMADTAPVLIWVSDPDKRRTYFNRPWLDFTGRTMEQEAGDGWTAGVHPRDLARCLETYKSAFDDRRPFEMEHRLRRHDGAYRWILARGTPRKTPDGEFAGYIGSCIDITERKQAEEALRDARVQLVTVTDTMSAAVVRCSADHRYVWVSRSYGAWLKRPADEFPGRSIEEILGPRVYQLILPHIERVLTGERVEYRNEVDFKDIGKRWVHAVYVPTFDSAAQPDGWVAVITDITASKQLEEALRDNEHKLRQQAEELEKQLIASGRLVSLGEITASMAHEFNNPLGIVMGFAQDLLSDKQPSHPDHHPLKIIYDESQRCAKIVKELLEFARPADADFSMVSIGPLIEKTIAFVSTRLYKSKIEAVTKVAEDLPAVLADPIQIEQVLVNLFFNAADAMLNGGRLTVEAARSEETSQEESTTVVITVSDNGAGMDATVLPYIFQPFFSANKKSGLGLGLAISERIVKNHGGRIEVQSAPGEGTKFKIYLPAIEPPPPQNDAASRTRRGRPLES